MEKRMIEIRDMVSGDCPAVAELMAGCFSDPWSEKALRDSLDEKGYVQLTAFIKGEDRLRPAAPDKDRLIAYAGYKGVLGEADIVNVCVHPQYRKRKAAASLIRALLDRAVKEGIRAIYLEVRVSNVPAIRLYEKAGFRQCGIRRDYYKKPVEDALLMIWKKEEIHA